MLCRGHLGGFAVGAAAAWLIGPRLAVAQVPGGLFKGKQLALVDEPRVPVLAAPPRMLTR